MWPAETYSISAHKSTRFVFRDRIGKSSFWEFVNPVILFNMIWPDERHNPVGVGDFLIVTRGCAQGRRNPGLCLRNAVGVRSESGTCRFSEGFGELRQAKEHPNAGALSDGMQARRLAIQQARRPALRGASCF